MKSFLQFLIEANSNKRIEYLVKKYSNKIKTTINNTTLSFSELKEISEEMQLKIHYSIWSLKLITTDRDGNSVIEDKFIEYIVEFCVKVVDPTKGKYADWIISKLLVLIDHYTKQYTLRWFEEDYTSVTTNIVKYTKYKKYFKQIENGENYDDLNKIESFEELWKSLNLIKNFIEQAEIDESKVNVKKIYSSENYYILIPETEEAACLYGKGTLWCTAATGSYNYFDRYNNEGPLYIIINRKTNKKWQFHFETEQYMNEMDQEEPLEDFFINNQELIVPFLDIVQTRFGERKGMFATLPRNFIHFMRELGRNANRTGIPEQIQEKILNFTTVMRQSY
jgi:hypothetical protein